MSLNGSLCIGTADSRSISADNIVALLKLVGADKVRLTIVDLKTDVYKEIGLIEDYQAAARMLRSGNRLWFECFDDKWSPMLLADMARYMTPDIRGDFDPSSVSISCGRFREIVEEHDNESVRDLGELYVTVTFFGYGFPRSVDRFNNTVFSLPSLVKLERELESIVGPVLHFTSLAA